MISCRVVNALPLIFLTKVGLLDVLQEQGAPALVPDVVIAEVGGLDPDDPAIRAVQRSPWMRVVTIPAIPDTVPAWDLDAGESEIGKTTLSQLDSAL